MESGGFLFYTENDGRQAEAEQRKIEYLEERIDYTRPESILHVYDKAIQEQLFKTPVGLIYLKKLQDFLLKQPKIEPERVKAIPLYDTYVEIPRKISEPNKPNPQRIRQREGKRAQFHISVALNILLVLAIIAMFWISFFSEHPNIFNYERALQDRYASWEEELTAREQAVREKERELDIDGLNSVLGE